MKTVYEINIFTHMTREELIKLNELARTKYNANIVEIGSYLGASSCSLAFAVKENKGKLFCVDTWMNHEMTEGERDTFEEFTKNIKPFNEIITIKRGWSADISKTFEEEVDLIYFDGGHSYNTVKSDWMAWSPKLKKSSIVVFHDTGWAEGVKKVVNENVRSKCTKEDFLPNMWWGWIR